MAKRGPAAEAARLRQEAEDCQPGESAGAAEPTENLRLLQELQVHQVDLELQNLELRRSAEEQADLLKVYTGLYDFAPVGYLSLDVAGSISRANLSASSLLGMERSGLLGMAFQQFLTGESRIAFLAFLAKRFAGQAADSCVLACLDYFGTRHWIRMDAAPVAPGTQECRATFVEISAQVDTQVALSHSEALFRALFSALPVGVTLTNAEGDILMTNPASEALLGIPSDDLLRRNFRGPCWDILRPDGSPMPPEEYASVRALTERRRIESVAMGVRRPDGEIVWLQVTAEPAPGPDLGVLITYVDVSAQKRSQEALLDSETRYRGLFDLSPDPITLTRTRDGVLVKVNPAWCALTGLSAEEALGPTAASLGTFPNPEHRIQLVADIEREGVASSREVQIRGAGGDIRQVLMSATTLNLEGEPLLLVMGKDVSERHWAEVALRESEARFRVVAEGSPVALLLQREGLIRYLNPAALRLFSASDSSRLIGQPFLDRIHPEDREASKVRIQSIQSTDREMPLRQLRYLALDGEVVEVEATGRKVSYEGQEAILVFAQDITERKRLLDRNTRLLREQAIILENANVGISVVVDRKQAWVNPWMVKTFGYRMEEMVGQTTRMLYGDDETYQRLGQEAYPVLAKGETYETVQRLTRKDGQPLWVHYNGRAIDPSDLSQGTLWLLNDITRTKEDQDALRESEMRFRAMFELNLAPQLIIDPDNGIILDANQAATAFYGYVLEELRGSPISQLNQMPEEKIFAAMAQARKLGLRHFEFQHRLADGRIREVEVYSSPIPMGPRTVLYSVVHDITERKAAQAAMVQSETRFRQVFDASPSAMSLSLAEGGQILQVNDAWAQLFGWTREEALGRTLLDLGIYANAEERQRLLGQFQTEGTVSDCPFKTQCKDGTQKFLRLGVSKIQLDGQTCYLAVLLDHTELHQAEEALLDLNHSLEQRVAQELAQRMAQERTLIHQSRLAAMGEMVGNIAHQWRQPLSTLSMILINLQETRRFNQLTDDYLESSVRDGGELIRKMSSTISDFTNFLRPDKAPTPFSLRVQAEEAVRLLKPSLDSRGVQVEIEGDAGIQSMGHPNEFSHVLINLLTNSRDEFLASGRTEGTVHIRIAAAGGRATLRYQDDAGGIRMDPLERIFEPYVTDKASGTGLGLYMSRMILVQSMAGSLTVSNLEGGAEFLISMPHSEATHDHA